MREHVNHLPSGFSPAHREWSRRLYEANPAELREQVRHIEQSANELGVWERGGFLPLQPFVLDAEANRSLHAVAHGVKELLVDHALTAARGDLNRLADIAEWPADDRWFLGAEAPLSYALSTVRPDVFISGGRPRILEVNIGTCLNGGTTSSVLASALLGSPIGVGMHRTNNLVGHSYMDELIEFVRQAHTGDTPDVALLAFSDDGDEGSLRWADEHAARFAEHGIPCEFVPIDEAEVVDGHLTWRGKRYGIAIRYFMVRPDETDHLDFFTELHNATGTILFGSYVSQLFTSKNLLADLLQDDQLTANQRELLDHVPWTARLGKGFVRKGDSRVDPTAWAADNRERAVLKPSNLFGARGLVVGHRTTEAEWRDALDNALHGGSYVVQELVNPDSWPSVYWHLESESLVAANSPVLLGPFLVGRADGGVYTQQPIKGTEDDFLDRTRDVSLGCVVTA
jgi:hypothetical protein